MPAQGIHVRDQTARTVDRNSHKLAGLAKRHVAAGPGEGTATINDKAARIEFEVDFDSHGPLTVNPSNDRPVRYSSRLLTVVFTPHQSSPPTATVAVYKNGVALTPVGAGSSTISISGTALIIPSFYVGFSADLDLIRIETLSVTTAGLGLHAVARFG